eukprot:TRINITY_DN366_c0_g2_i1.p1 TRINITY_DN366_c0_g2~~TRINITY_DN366_c0_g2_i1.p1  ORF type:complete len:752 (-),score=168.40 TRINITY_DN366_c0_g2_i1:27-2282(-)
MTDTAESDAKRRRVKYDPVVELPPAPAFRPTLEEWSDPLRYIESIRPIAEKAGVCRVITPVGWNPAPALDDHIPFRTRVQRVHLLRRRSAQRSFVAHLREFYNTMGKNTPPTQLIGGQKINLHRLFTVVMRMKGFEGAGDFATVATRLGLAVEHAPQLKKLYQRSLLDFEQGAARPEMRVSCDVCNTDVDEDLLLLCDNAECAHGLHTYCADPVMVRVPMGEWICPQCTAESQAGGSGASKPSEPLLGFGFEDGPNFTLDEFRAVADEFSRCHFPRGPPNPDAAERKYWSIVEADTGNVTVLYGSELDGSAVGVDHCPVKPVVKCESSDAVPTSTVSAVPSAGPADSVKQEPLAAEDVTVSTNASSADAPAEADVKPDGSPTKPRVPCKPMSEYSASWSLPTLHRAPGSLLKDAGHVPGVTVPWVYVGMLFTSFCWHNEDNFLYSINYLHEGCPKLWYGVPGSAAEQFEEAMRKLNPQLFARTPHLLMGLVTATPPGALSSMGIPIVRAVQNPGDCVITFPRAYHAGFNLGFNVAEAVNFASPSWLLWGRTSVSCYRAARRAPALVHDEVVIGSAVAALAGQSDLCTAEVLAELTALTNREENALLQMQQLGANACALPSAQGALAAARVLLLSDDKALALQMLQSRARTVASSMSMGMGMGGRVIVDNDLDSDDIVCMICKSDCYVSFAACSCSPGKTCCLAHMGELCSCDLSSRVVGVRMQLKDLQRLCQMLAQQLLANSQRQGQVIRE